MPRKHIPIKNHYQEIQLVVRRTMIAVIIMCALVGILISRLFYLQIYKHNVYSTLSTKNWLDLIPIEPTRGLIYDRNGVLLAENIPVFSLDIIPNQVTHLENTITALKKLVVLSENDLKQFQKQLKQKRPFNEIPLKLRLSEEEAARIAENQYKFPGVVIKGRLMRYYPYGNSFSHVLGYVGRINSKELTEIDPINYSASHYIGKSGIEKYYEDDLHGYVGYEEVENDASSKPIRVLKKTKSKPGKNLFLSLDIKLQLIAEKAMGDHRGAVVIIQPNTGQVLAMVSQPGFDPNVFVQGISQQDYQTLQLSKDRPLYNRALQGLYPLASTIKPYLGLGALEIGAITAEDTIYDPGWFKLRNNEHVFRDHHPHGVVNLTRAIIMSCDTYFYNLSLKLGIKRMDHILNQFGFGAPTGIDLDNEFSGIVASPEWKRKMKGSKWYDGDTIISSIGQGSMQGTPLQLAQAVATIANRGQRFVPYLLLGEQTPGNAYIPQTAIPLDTVNISNKHWDTVIKAMENVVSSPHGTARPFFGPRTTFTIAGKTGTAQVIAKRNRNEVDNQKDLPERFRDHNLFVSFAPIEQPEIALAVITENSHDAVQVAREIINYALGTETHVRLSQVTHKETRS